MSFLAGIWGVVHPPAADDVFVALSRAPVWPLLLPIPVFVVVASRVQRAPFFHPELAKYIDARAGSGAFESFLVRLRPMLMFGISVMFSAALQIWKSSRHDEPLANGASVFLLSSGIGFILAHCILRARKVAGA